MILPAALARLAPYTLKALDIAPYAISAFTALYGLSEQLGERYGDQLREINEEYKRDGFVAIREHSGEILRAASYAIARGVHDAVDIYRQVKANIKPIISVSDPRKGTVVGALIFFSLLSLSYFALVPQKTTARLIAPMTTNVPGLVLSFILLCIGAWVVLKKD